MNNNQDSIRETQQLNQRPVSSPKSFRTRKIGNSASQNQFQRPQTSGNNPSLGSSQLYHNRQFAATSKAGGSNPKLFTTMGVVRKSQKGIPNNIKHDKEQQYEEISKLKREINELRDENLKLKTTATKLEKEATKYERMLEEQCKPHTNSRNIQMIQENSMTVRLKKKLKDLERELEIKNKEFQKLKRDHRFTQNQELKEELQIYQETAKIQQIRLNQAMKANTQFQAEDQTDIDVVEKQNRQINILKQDNVELAVIIKQLEDQFQEKNNQFNELDRKYQNLVKETAFLRRQMSENEKKVKNESLAPYAKPVKQNNTQQEQINQLKQENEQKTEDNIRLREKLKSSQVKYKELEDQSKNQKNELQTQLEIRDSKINKMEREWVKKSEVENLNSNQDEWKEKYSALEIKYNELKEQHDNQQKQHQNTLNAQNGQDQRKSYLDAKKNQQIKRQTQIVKRQMPKVKSYDVKKLGKDLQFGLINQRISLDEALAFLFSEDSVRRQKQSIKETVNILQTQPFNMTNFDDALLVARYLIEDNNEETIIVDENRTQDLAIIKDVFKKFVNKYELFSLEQIVELHQQMSEVITRFSSSLCDNIKLYIQKKTDLKEGTCQYEDFEKAKEYCEMNLSNKESDYLAMIYFEKSHDSDIIYYLDLVKQLKLEKMRGEGKVEEFQNEIQQKIQEKEKIKAQLQEQGLQARFDAFYQTQDERHQREEEQRRIKEEQEEQERLELEQKKEQRRREKEEAELLQRQKEQQEQVQQDQQDQQEQEYIEEQQQQQDQQN